MVFALLTAATSVAAEEGSRPGDDTKRFMSFTFENDVFAGTDRHYTNGAQLAFLADLHALPDGLRALPPLAWSADRYFVASVGQRIFTPSDLSQRIPEVQDRPYAGWLYVMGDFRVRQDSVVDHFIVNLGVVGPDSGAHETQNSVHRFIGSKQAVGWDTQISNHATWMLGYERAWRNALSGEFAGHSYDLTPRVAGWGGNVLTYAEAGAIARYGRNLPFDLPATHISLGPARDGYRGTSQFGWYGWAGVDARAVAKNIFIDGHWTHDGADIHREPYGFDVELGAALAWPSARVSFALVQRSREFSEQVKPDRYGQLSVAFAY
jgi:hypothetical protein